MDIQKNVNYSTISCLFLLVTFALIEGNMSFGNHSSTVEALLTATYKSDPAIRPSEAAVAAANLEKVLADCKDGYLTFRIRYRIGVMYFKAHMMEASKAAFLQVLNNPECPELIRICSFNMIGHINRLSGENEEALEFFGQVVNLLSGRLSAEREHSANSTLMNIWCSALCSRAEIYELQRDYNAGIIEYKRLLQGAARNKSSGILEQYAPLVNDRISQLYLRQGDIGKYIKVTEVLTLNYPEYYRAPIVRLEIECVKYLKNTLRNPKFVNGSYGAPSRVIAYLKGSKDKALTQAINNKLDRLCREHHGTYGGVLVEYHYGWFLDALGDKDKATKILNQIFSFDVINPDNESWRRPLIETIQEYAKIQCVIMLGEGNKYAEALRVLGSLIIEPERSHILELAESVRKSIQTLRREVPKNENKQR